MNIWMIDNYDSFTYNLVHYIEDLLQQAIHVVRNDQFQLKDLEHADALIVSPGPGIPDEAGLTKAAIRAVGLDRPVLGVCLGHQSIGEVFGARLKNLSRVHHGVDCQLVMQEKDPLFTGLEVPLTVGRYHSWVIDPDSLPETLVVTSTDEDGEIMSIRHRDLPIWGVQFHPESVLTPLGKPLLDNFFNHCIPSHESHPQPTL